MAHDIQFLQHVMYFCFVNEEAPYIVPNANVEFCATAWDLVGHSDVGKLHRPSQ
jgi:hypothetical protein